MNEGEYLNGESMNDPHNGDNEGEYQIDHNQGDTSQFNHETRQEEENEQEKVIINGATHVLSLLRQIGKGYHLMCKYAFNSLIKSWIVFIYTLSDY